MVALKCLTLNKLDKELEDQLSDDPTSDVQERQKASGEASNFTYNKPAGIVPITTIKPLMSPSLSYLTPSILQSEDKLFIISHSHANSDYKE